MTWVPDPLAEAAAQLRVAAQRRVTTVRAGSGGDITLTPREIRDRIRRAGALMEDAKLPRWSATLRRSLRRLAADCETASTPTEAAIIARKLRVLVIAAAEGERVPDSLPPPPRRSVAEIAKRQYDTRWAELPERLERELAGEVDDDEEFYFGE